MISFTRVTWYSQIAAIILFVAVWVVGFFIGRYAVSTVVSDESFVAISQSVQNVRSANNGPIVNGATFSCSLPSNGFISTIFYKNAVTLTLSDGRSFALPQVISASGARYAHGDNDDSFVFWNKGNTAFVTENGTTTFDGCVTK